MPNSAYVMRPAAYNARNVKMYLIQETTTATTTRSTAINMTTTAAATTVNGKTLKLKWSCGFHRKTYH